MAADLTPERRAMLRARTPPRCPWCHGAGTRPACDGCRDCESPFSSGTEECRISLPCELCEAWRELPDLLDITDEADALRAEVERLREGVECHVARPGEGTYECRLDRKCPACRLRDAEAEVERLRAEVGETFGMAFARAEALGRAEAENERLRAKNRDLTELLRVHGRLDGMDEALREADEALEERSEG